MPKKIYICGDSFGCPDLGWKIDCWPILLAKKLGDGFQIINLSISCASNFLIRVQVDRAIQGNADFVIMLATSCTRSQGLTKTPTGQYTDIYDRFVRIGQIDPNSKTRDLACYSIKSLNDTCVFDKDRISLIRNYQIEMFDLDLAIAENQYMIESSLYALESSGIPFIFDQGGFENPSFGDIKTTDYFQRFSRYKSELNQWTEYSKLPPSGIPHLHIVDQLVHERIADYYREKIST